VQDVDTSKWFPIISAKFNPITMYSYGYSKTQYIRIPAWDPCGIMVPQEPHDIDSDTYSCLFYCRFYLPVVIYLSMLALIFQNLKDR
jgi:hypothetical protein